MPGGQPGDHDQAHHPGHGDVDHGRCGQPLVQLGELVGRDADAVVLDVEDGPVADPARLDDDRRVRRRERGRVVEQLGDEVDQVVDRVRGDLDVPVDDPELDPGVVLDLGLRGAQHVDQGGRLALYAGRVGTGEYQQVLVVAAHPGGQVVQLEQFGQPVRVLLAALQPVEVADQPVDQDLRTTGQVDEHRRHRGPQGGLLGGGAYGFQVYRVEGLGHLAELVSAADRQRFGDLLGHLVRGQLAGQRRVTQPGHRLRQAELGDTERAVPQFPQRARHRPGNQPRDQYREQDQGGEQPTVQVHLGLRAVAQLLGVRRDLLVDRLLDFADLVGPPGQRLVPLIGAEREGQLVRDPEQLVGVDAGLAHVRAGDALLLQVLLGRGGDHLEGGQRLFLPLDRADEIVERLRGQLARVDDPQDLDALLRHELLVLRDGGRGAHLVAERRVTGELGRRVADLQQAGDQSRVAVDGDARGYLRGVALADLLAQRADRVEPVVDGLEHCAEVARYPGQRGPVRRVLVRRVVAGLDEAGELGGRVLLPVGGVVGGQQPGHRGPLVLQVVDEQAAVLGQLGEVAGPLGVVRGGDVRGQRTEADDHRRQGRYQHDQAQLEPDRPVLEVPDQPPYQGQGGASTRRWSLGHLSRPFASEPRDRWAPSKGRPGRVGPSRFHHVP